MCDNHSHNRPTDHHHSGAPADAGAANPADLAQCPVMPDSTVVKADAEAAGLVRDYQGTRYWLCCSSCGPMFDADPAEYATAG